MTVIVPLFDAAAGPDDWHHVTAPGGYEWRYFYAYDASSDLRVTAHFFEGFPFDPDYLRRYASYRRRPTHHTPPVPRDYPRVCVKVHQNGGMVWQDSQSSSVRRTEMGWSLNLRGQPPLSAELLFRPRFTHRTDSDSVCDVEGTVMLPDAKHSFRGRGYHDHQFATTPLAAGRRMRLRIDEGERVVIFHENGSVIQHDRAGMTSLADEIISIGRMSRSSGAPAYPELIRAAGHVFEKPLVLSRGKYFAEVAYRSNDTTAIAQVIDPPANL